MRFWDRDLPPRLPLRLWGVVLLSAPLAVWVDLRIRQLLRGYRIHPRAAHAAYFRGLERTWSFAHDLVVLLTVCALVTVCIEALVQFLRGE